MHSYRNKPAFQANGTIAAATAVKIDTSTNFACLQAVAGDPAIGIAQLGQEYSPLTIGGVSLPTFAATNGDPIHVFFDGEFTEVQLGGTVAAGTFCTPDSNGYAVAATGGQPIFCQTITAGVANDLVPCIVKIVPATNSKNVISTAVSVSLTTDQVLSNPIVIVTATGQTVTLPGAATAPGGTVRVFNAVAASNTAVLPGVTGTDAVQGNNLTIATGHGIINSSAGAHLGDTVTLVSDGVSKWNIADIIGTWAAD